MRLPVIFTAAVLAALPANATWLIQTSLFRCEATWFAPWGYVRLVDDRDTRDRRLDLYPDLDHAKPVVQIYYSRPMAYERFSELYGYRPRCGPVCLTTNTRSEDDPIQDLPNGNHTIDAKRTELDMEVRLFPDDDGGPLGFFPVKMHMIYFAHSHTDPGRDHGPARIMEWTGFDLHDRFKRWGTAKETRDDEGVRVPEVRLILKWTRKRDVDFIPSGGWKRTWAKDLDVTYHAEYPMWRTSNVMNKLERCGEELIDDWGDGGNDPSN